MNKLKEFRPTKSFLVCIDSDGCVFDSMELKHKECFIPATVNIWNLQGISKYVRETSEFVNLYSKTRGMNRFPALVRTFKLLKKRPEVQERHVEIPDLSVLEDWINKTPDLSEEGLKAYIDTLSNPNPVLAQSLAWSVEVNTNIEHVVRGVVPFPYVRESLAEIKEVADIAIVSSTPYEAIVREWSEQGLTTYVDIVAGQEQGTKAQCIASLAEHYDNHKIIMIGDAQSDKKSADDNHVNFYPIIPNNEVYSWKNLYDSAFKTFVSNAYDNENNKYYIAFKKVLIDEPHWLSI